MGYRIFQDSLELGFDKMMELIIGRRSSLLKDKDAPEYMREISITTGYRQRLSYKACLFSWFTLHNETVNIWSHLIGFFIFMYCLVLIVLWPPSDALQESHLSIFPLVIQLISYQVCMLSSTLFHTFSCHSEEAHDSWQETDHLGILCALFGTYISLLSITFICFPTFKIIHLSIVVIIFMCVVSARYFPILGKQAKKTISASASPRIPLSIFLAVSLYSIVPLSHWIWLHGGISNHIVQERLRQIILPFLSGGIGLVFYVTRFPEKMFRAGSVDILGSSHQVWHVMIFLGMMLWYRETSTSLLSHSGVCSGLKHNSTHIFDGETGLPETGDIMRALANFVYLDIIFSYSLDIVMNIF